MFRGLFGKKRSVPRLVVAEHGDFTVWPWVEANDAVNGNAFSDKARAQGRYEIASAFHQIGTEWYASNVVHGMPGDSEERLESFREHLRELQEAAPELRRLIEVRGKILEALSRHINGIERDLLKKELNYEGKTSWGVLCNQLARGGWLEQSEQGRKKMLKPVLEAPITNQQFLDSTIPAPGTSGVGL